MPAPLSAGQQTDVFREWQGESGSAVVTSGLTVSGGDLMVTDGGLNLMSGPLTAGDLTVGLVNGQTISSAASLTGSLSIANGLTVLAGAIALGAGAVTAGLINGQTVSSAANFTGTVAVASSLAVGQTPTPITQIRVYTPTLTPGTVLATLSGEQTFSVPGLTTADTVTVSGPAPTAGTGIVNVRVSAADTLAVTFINDTIGSLTPTAGVYRILAVRS